MGVWGADNFENDSALDFVANSVIKPMTACLQRAISHPELADPDEMSDEIMAAVQILVVVCDTINAAPPSLRIVEQCRDICLLRWDAGIDAFEPKAGYKSERRKIIADTFEKLVRICQVWEEN